MYQIWYMNIYTVQYDIKKYQTVFLHCHNVTCHFETWKKNDFFFLMDKIRGRSCWWTFRNTTTRWTCGRWAACSRGWSSGRSLSSMGTTTTTSSSRLPRWIDWKFRGSLQALALVVVVVVAAVARFLFFFFFFSLFAWWYERDACITRKRGSR